MARTRSKRLSFKDREARILKAAGHLFAKRGFRGTTTRAIAEEAGVNEALLFRHFPSKAALFDALLTEALESWTQAIVPALDDMRRIPLEKALIAIAKLLIRRVEDDPGLLRMMFFASLADHRLGELFFKKPLPVRDFIAALFRERQQNGELRKQDPDMLAATYLSMIFHYIYMKDIFGAAESYYGNEGATLRFFTDVFLNGSAT